MNTLTAKQLSFLLKCSVDDARRMMATAYEKERGSTVKTFGIEKGKAGYHEDDYPKQMEISVLSKNLNIPHLQTAVNDIAYNYLDRKVTRAYILNYPNEIIQKKIAEAGSIEKVVSHLRISLPNPLNTMLSPTVKDVIKKVWTERYSKYKFVELNVS